MSTHLKLVQLMEPNLCFTCNFATLAKVEMEDGSHRRMLHCKKLDCDNWEDAAENAGTPQSIIGDD